MADNVIINIKPVYGEDVNDKGMLAVIRKAFEAEAKKVESEFGKGTATWTHKPRWKIEIKTRRNDWVARVFTGDKPFVYVELGTLKGGRYRRMSRDWQSKTTPKSLHSGAGGGRAAGFIPKGTRPMKGLTPRDFRVIIAEEQQPKYARNMQFALKVGSSQFFSGRSISPASTGFR